jgi:DNA-binding NarL/FixJ family response regulator
MRILLVGPVADRNRLRARLAAASFQIAAEAATMEAARALELEVDAFVVAASGGNAQEAIDEAGEDGGFEVRLTPREIEVLELLALGQSNKVIAGRLAISDQTVKFHVASICGKLGAVNRTDAVRRGVRRGLIVL